MGQAPFFIKASHSLLTHLPCNINLAPLQQGSSTALIFWHRYNNLQHTMPKNENKQMPLLSRFW
jgi:hypothetical protein